MPAIPAIPTVPELGQTTLDFTGPYIAKKPGKRAKPETMIPLRRSTGSTGDIQHRWIAGESAHEAVLVRQFEAARIVMYDDNESDLGGYALHRNSYSKELKLSAVQWAINTVVRGKKPGDPLKPITGYEAAARLSITTTMLRSWIRHRVCIANQKKGSRRGRNVLRKGRESVMEHALFKEFEEARGVGKAVGC